MIEIDQGSEIYWVRTSPDGRVTAALVERAFTKEELPEWLDEMRKHGEIRRVLASSVVIGEALKLGAAAGGRTSP